MSVCCPPRRPLRPHKFRKHQAWLDADLPHPLLGALCTQHGDVAEQQVDAGQALPCTAGQLSQLILVSNHAACTGGASSGRCRITAHWRCSAGSQCWDSAESPRMGPALYSSQVQRGWQPAAPQLLTARANPQQSKADTAAAQLAQLAHPPEALHALSQNTTQILVDLALSEPVYVTRDSCSAQESVAKRSLPSTPQDTKVRGSIGNEGARPLQPWDLQSLHSLHFTTALYSNWMSEHCSLHQPTVRSGGGRTRTSCQASFCEGDGHVK